MFNLNRAQLLDNNRANPEQYKETIWLPLDEDAFDRKKNDTLRHCKDNSIVEFWNLWSVINTHYDRPEYHDLLKWKYKASRNIHNLQGWKELELYFITGNSEQDVWYVCGNKMILYGKDFGVLKFALMGFAGCANRNLLPMHAWIINTELGGIAFVGNRYWWKTTMVIHAMDVYDAMWLKPKLVSDDWWFAKWKNPTDIRTNNHNVSLNEQAYKDFPSLKIFENIDWNALTSRKIAFDPSFSYWKDSATEETKLSAVVLLSQQVLWSIEYIMSGFDVAGFIINSATHYPYYSSVQKKHHKLLWADSLSRIGLDYYDRSESMQEYLKKLVNQITLFLNNK